MKTIEEIKNEVAKKFQGYASWDFMAKNDPICLEDQEMVDEVVKRYATEAIKADRERVAENAKLRMYKKVVHDLVLTNNTTNRLDLVNLTSWAVDKESIINLPIELP